MKINDIELIESQEFTSLLEAVEMMAKAQGDLSNLTKAVTELKILVDSGADALPSLDEAIVCDIVETMQNLVDDLSEEEISNI